ncbi:MAG: HdeA/HdeB family chaperone [Candidatus Cybelea sp.]
MKRLPMSQRSIAIVAFVALLGASPAPSAPTPAPRIDITKVTCGDLIKSSPLDRSAVVMFYWGYAAEKAGVSSFRTGILETATRHLMNICLKNPSETIVRAMDGVDVKAF